MTCVCACTLQEAAHTRELAQWDTQIRARNDELTQLTSENTRCLTAVAEYTRSQMDMEDTLTNTQVQLFICLHCNVPCTCCCMLLLGCAWSGDQNTGVYLSCARCSTLLMKASNPC